MLVRIKKRLVQFLVGRKYKFHTGNFFGVKIDDHYLPNGRQIINPIFRNKLNGRHMKKNHLRKNILTYLNKSIPGFSTEEVGSAVLLVKNNINFHLTNHITRND